MSHATITDLIVYPVKSCRGIAIEEAQELKPERAAATA